jgi:hypothetical protein
MLFLNDFLKLLHKTPSLFAICAIDTDAQRRASRAIIRASPRDVRFFASPIFFREVLPARSRSRDFGDFGEEVWEVPVVRAAAEGVLVENFVGTILPASKTPEALADHQVDV